MSRIGTRAEYHKALGKLGGKKLIMGKDNCPFCNIEKTKNTLIHKFKYWRIILNKFPYSGQENHLMAVPIRHVQFVDELNAQEFSELPEVHAFAKKFFQENGQEHYFSATRETMGNRSVEHYHMHFVPGILQGKFIRCMLENQGYPIEAEVKIQK